MDEFGRISLKEACDKMEEFLKLVRKEGELKYEPYIEPKLEWVKDNLNVKDKETGTKYKITGIDYVGDGKWKITLDQWRCVYLLEMFEHYTWLNGTPFGEEIK